MESVARSLDDRVVVVTGGNGGLGRATCRVLAAAGATVVAADVDAQKAREVASELDGVSAEPGRHLGLRVDVSSETDVDAMIAATLERFQRIDALVTCAGILRHGKLAPKRIADVTVEEFDRVISVNLRGVFLCNRAVLKPMAKQRGGVIINVSSVQGLAGRAYDGPYCASKFGVNGLTQSLAEEVRAHGIKVMAIMPAAIDTPMWDQNGPIASPDHALPPERVADFIVYLLQQPDDTVTMGTVIAPMRTRKRKPRSD